MASWYGILLGVTFVGGEVLFGGEVLYNVLSFPDKWTFPGPPLVKLTTRIYHRASSLALRSFLERARESLRAPLQAYQGSEDGRAVEPELFIQLHNGYARLWQIQHDLGKDVFTFWVAMVGPMVTALIMIINMAVAQCVVFWTVNYLFFALTWLAVMLFVLPIANEQIVTITSLYSDAQKGTGEHDRRGKPSTTDA
jgi:hypothetical protein